MLITLVPNPNFVSSAKMMNDDALLQSFISAAVTLNGLRLGRISTNCDKMWQGYANGLYSYLLVLDAEVQSRKIEEVDRSYLDCFASVGMTPNCENVPGWIMDKEINESHAAYILNPNTENLVYPF